MANKKVIGIVGSRRRNSLDDFKIVEKEFLSLYHIGDAIVSGSCRQGADYFAERIARDYGVTMIIYHAPWKRLGKGAGLWRNTFIAKRANILIACVAENRLGGVEDTIRKFKISDAKADWEKRLFIV